MSKEELLKPRYKIIAGYPNMESDQHGIGDIISPYGMGFVYPDKVKEQYDKYPHLFNPLKWWEEREEKDMPDFVWYDESGFENAERLKCLKVKKWVTEPDGEMWADVEGSKIGYATFFMKSPANEPEYNEYIAKK